MERGKGWIRGSRRGEKGDILDILHRQAARKSLFGLEGPPRDPFCAGPIS